MFPYLIPKFSSYIGFTPLSMWLAHIGAAKIVPCFKFSPIPVCLLFHLGNQFLWSFLC